MPITYLEDYELKKHTTFKIGGKAKRLFIPETTEELIEILHNACSPVILGGCSNVLISSDGINGEVILTTELKRFEILGRKISADCGVRVPVLSRAAQKNGLSGFEFMAGFPGTTGGVVLMNASAHGQSVCETFYRCRVFDMNKKEVLTLEKKDMLFEYRKSILSSKNYILLDAEFELKEQEPELIAKQMQKNINFRKEKQPGLTLPNAGSVFKNPPGDSAGRLLEEAGARGLKEGGAKIWEGHCNFIVNYENAQSRDVLCLMYKMYNMVKEKFNIKLEPEIRFIGKANEEESKLWNMMLKKL